MDKYNILSDIVSISSFNKGKAGKIFDEMKKTGMKIVVKNNKPECVMLTPQKYEELIEKVENYDLLMEAAERYEKSSNKDFIDEKELLKRFKIEDKDLENVEVELD
ncbi:MAG: type II toxin-antitoxin system Phd/YefM family antitoxin [Bacillota bacterium]|nr:type II toxin-antitoxin system Phd/YefM family antitoxin [Bacillota bacterium]